jgi:Transposase IS66 family
MRTWLETTLATLSRKSDTAAAIRYALSRWRALTRYAKNGQLEKGFGWLKQTGPLRQVKIRGLERWTGCSSSVAPPIT